MVAESTNRTSIPPKVLSKIDVPDEPIYDADMVNVLQMGAEIALPMGNVLRRAQGAIGLEGFCQNLEGLRTRTG